MNGTVVLSVKNFQIEAWVISDSGKKKAAKCWAQRPHRWNGFEFEDSTDVNRQDSEFTREKVQ